MTHSFMSVCVCVCVCILFLLTIEKEVKVRLLSIQSNIESQFDVVLKMKREKKKNLQSQGAVISDEFHKSSSMTSFLFFHDLQN